MSLTRSSALRPLATGQLPAQSLLQRGLLALAASAFVAVCAHIAVPVSFTPVPFTLQPFAVLLMGMLLGPATGFAAMVAYLCEGAAGLPVFTPAGPGGVAQLLGPTAGFLFAYPAAAALAGAAPALLRSRRFLAFVATGLAAMLVVFASGAAWFAHALHVTLPIALTSAVLPFAPSDAVKVCAAAGIASAVLRRKEA